MPTLNDAISQRPNFLCVGFPRSGTTWLNRALELHPQIFVPERVKEVNYFNWNYFRGEAWYLNHFKPAGPVHLAVGEVSPAYIFSDVAADRISAFSSELKIIVMLRKPRDKIVSAYHLSQRASPYANSRTLFLKHHGSEFLEIRASHTINEYIKHFGRANVCILLTEEISGADGKVYDLLAKFLGVSREGFSDPLRVTKVNPNNTPRIPILYRAARRLRDAVFPRFELERWVWRMPSLGRLIYGKSSRPPKWLYEEISARKELINQEIRELEIILERDLTHWREP